MIEEVNYEKEDRKKRGEREVAVFCADDDGSVS